MMRFDLMKFVLDRLPSARSELEVIATRSKVPIHTLLKIANGETKNPRVRTAQALYDTLKRKRGNGASARA